MTNNQLVSTSLKRFIRYKRTFDKMKGHGVQFIEFHIPIFKHEKIHPIKTIGETSYFQHPTTNSHPPDIICIFFCIIHNKTV